MHLRTARSPEPPSSKEEEGFWVGVCLISRVLLFECWLIQLSHKPRLPQALAAGRSFIDGLLPRLKSVEDRNEVLNPRLKAW